jgi:hypothetical protein
MTLPDEPLRGKALPATLLISRTRGIHLTGAAWNGECPLCWHALSELHGCPAGAHGHPLTWNGHPGTLTRRETLASLRPALLRVKRTPLSRTVTGLI